MTAPLFTPLEIGGRTLVNRIAVSPMCQYSADDGSATDWHLAHWVSMAMSGAGMVTVEATAVERRGRITHGDLGIYSDDNEAAAQRALSAARRVAPPGTLFGIQLAHAGRKASTQRPWEGGKSLKPDADAWTTVAPSAIPFDEGWHVPEALDAKSIAAIVERFVEAAKRAERAGFDYVEVHGAHGYLIHEFLSPLSNQRTDAFGGTLENRMRLLHDVTKAVRAALPQRMFVGARLSASEWVEGGFSIDEAVKVAQMLKGLGVVYVCASSGGNVAKAVVPTTPLYQVPFAERIRREAGVVTQAVGMIEQPEQANGVIAEGKADIVALARALLADPRWPWRAAAALGADVTSPPQYVRSVPLLTKWVAPAERKTAA